MVVLTYFKKNNIKTDMEEKKKKMMLNDKIKIIKKGKRILKEKVRLVILRFIFIKKMVHSLVFCHMRKERYKTFIMNNVQVHVRRIIFPIVRLT